MLKHRAMDQIALMIVVAIILSACDNLSQDATPVPDVKYPAEASAAVQAAKADLIKITNANQQSISVVTVDKKNWPTSALGCPQQGMSYTDSFVPGYLILLSVNGQSYEYHTDNQGISIAHCLLRRKSR